MEGTFIKSNHIKITISYKGELFHQLFPESTSLADLRRHIAIAFDPPLLCENQRLIVRGKQLPASGEDAAITLKDLQLNEANKIMLIATTTNSIKAVEEGKELEQKKRLKARDRDVINDFGNNSLARPAILPPRNWKGHEFGFMQIETLHGLDNPDKAVSILEELAADPGVLAVCKKYKWKIGSLKEMYPEGLVGVSDVCLMGLNKNKGEEILLRIRTDDLSGFRKMLSIKKVLYHELAHNVHSEHDAAFFQFMSQIEKEAQRYGQGNSVGGSMLPMMVGGKKVHAWQGSGQVGGKTPPVYIDNEGNASSEEVRRRLAEERLKVFDNQSDPTDKRDNKATRSDHFVEGNEREEKCPCCGVVIAQCTSCTTEDQAAQPTSQQYSATATEQGSFSQLLPPVVAANNHTTNRLRDSLLSLGFSTEKVSSAIQYLSSKQYTLTSSEEQQSLAIEYILLQEEVSSASTNRMEESSHYVNERQSKILDEASKLMQQVEGAAETADTLIGMLNQIMMDPTNQKWRKIRRNNKKFLKTIQAHHHALQLLYAIGFEVDEVNDWLVLHREDPGLVYLGISAIQKWRPLLV